jgi:hypothetical protein
MEDIRDVTDRWAKRFDFFFCGKNHVFYLNLSKPGGGTEICATPKRPLLPTSPLDKIIPEHTFPFEAQQPLQANKETQKGEQQQMRQPSNTHKISFPEYNGTRNRPNGSTNAIWKPTWRGRVTRPSGFTWRGFSLMAEVEQRFLESTTREATMAIQARGSRQSDLFSLGSRPSLSALQHHHLSCHPHATATSGAREYAVQLELPPAPPTRAPAPPPPPRASLRQLRSCWVRTRQAAPLVPLCR